MRPVGDTRARLGVALAYDQIWARPECVARALAKVDASPDDLDTPHRLSQFVSYRVNAQGCEESMRCADSYARTMTTRPGSSL